MKNSKNNFSADSFFQTQVELQSLKDEEARRQKRLWLRAKIYEITGISQISSSSNIAIFEEIFNWIYQAPLYEWEGMLTCFKEEARIGSYEGTLEYAKELYEFLK